MLPAARGHPVPGGWVRSAQQVASGSAGLLGLLVPRVPLGPLVPRGLLGRWAQVRSVSQASDPLAAAFRRAGARWWGLDAWS